jgi:hypothetical protein
MASRTSSVLKELEQIKDTYGGGVAPRKLNLLRALNESRLTRAKEVFRLHEVLCFLRAYPDDKEVLRQVEQMLDGFSARKDLMSHRKELINSGIAGTVISFPFYWFTAYWLARRWPNQISIDWSDFDKKGGLVEILNLLLPYSETPAIDELDFSAREWIERLRGPAETDAYFLIKRFKALRADQFGLEKSYESLDIPIRITSGSDAPSRTRARYPSSPVIFQTRPLRKVRTSFRREIRRASITIRSLPPREARKVIHLAREAMITRSRDLDAFEHASERDVRLVDCGQGLQFACIGVIPERRLLLEAVYGFLTLKNGVPIGYVLVGSLFRSSEVAFNMFETYRGAESGLIYSRVLAMARHLFGSDTFTVPPYQLGHGNPEALQSGAWWFYYKIGCRPRDPDVQHILLGELKQIKRKPRHRSSTTTLNRLASQNMFLSLGPVRRHVMGTISPGDIGLRISRVLADRFGADRELAVKTCSREAARLLGLRSLRGFSKGEKLAWQRWSPVIMALSGVEKWNQADLRALIQVVRAKGGRRESRFVELFDNHHRLQRALVRLSEKQ